jgi:hypothetical protein
MTAVCFFTAAKIVQAEDNGKKNLFFNAIVEAPPIFPEGAVGPQGTLFAVKGQK